MPLRNRSSGSWRRSISVARPDQTMRGGECCMERFSALIGFVVILGIAFLLSNNKRAIRWRTVGWGLLLQIVIAIAVLKGELIARLLARVALPLERYGAAILFVVLAIVVYQIAVRL